MRVIFLNALGREMAHNIKSLIHVSALAPLSTRSFRSIFVGLFGLNRSRIELNPAAIKELVLNGCTQLEFTVMEKKGEDAKIIVDLPKDLSLLPREICLSTGIQTESHITSEAPKPKKSPRPNLQA